jgi:hypothetical protein
MDPFPLSTTSSSTSTSTTPSTFLTDYQTRQRIATRSETDVSIGISSLEKQVQEKELNLLECQQLTKETNSKIKRVQDSIHTTLHNKLELVTNNVTMNIAIGKQTLTRAEELFINTEKIQEDSNQFNTKLTQTENEMKYESVQISRLVERYQGMITRLLDLTKEKERLQMNIEHQLQEISVLQERCNKLRTSTQEAHVQQNELVNITMKQLDEEIIQYQQQQQQENQMVIYKQEIAKVQEQLDMEIHMNEQIREIQLQELRQQSEFVQNNTMIELQQQVEFHEQQYMKSQQQVNDLAKEIKILQEKKLLPEYSLEYLIHQQETNFATEFQHQAQTLQEPMENEMKILNMEIMKLDQILIEEHQILTQLMMECM